MFPFHLHATSCIVLDVLRLESTPKCHSKIDAAPKRRNIDVRNQRQRPASHPCHCSTGVWFQVDVILPLQLERAQIAFGHHTLTAKKISLSARLQSLWEWMVGHTQCLRERTNTIAHEPTHLPASSTIVLTIPTLRYGVKLRIRENITICACVFVVR